MERTLTLDTIQSLDRVDPAAWNRLAGGYPFLRHEFLHGLEQTGCVGARTAWEPAHIVLSDEGTPVAALPLYVKHDSRGEFVFDWGWADAYERTGRPYYPKLVSAIPFTPATGPRLMLGPDAPGDAAHRLIAAARELADDIGASSLHVLFPAPQQAKLLRDEGLLLRKSCQFHWHNAGYADFDDFLGRFSSKKRKNARRERRRIAESGIAFEHLHGDELSRPDWDTVYEYHAQTFFRRGRPPYLNREMFDWLAAAMPESLVVILARYQAQPIATAICFCGAGALYGRYWGSLADFHSLHFETCYYQGIEYCIREGLALFEPGTQGEHKISRGFLPTVTWSGHWLCDADFGAAVADFLEREAAHVDAYMRHLDEHLPYRRE